MKFLYFPPYSPPPPFHPRRGAKGGPIPIWALDVRCGITREESPPSSVAPFFARAGRSETRSRCFGAGRGAARARTRASTKAQAKPFTTTVAHEVPRQLEQWRHHLCDSVFDARGQIGIGHPFAPQRGWKGAGGIGEGRSDSGAADAQREQGEAK